jgi:hypothetical protein
MIQSEGKRTPGFSNTEKDKLRKDNDTAENSKGILNHLKAAEHFSMASKCHYEAARYHEEGNHESANQSALQAMGHAFIANQHQIQDAKHHAME